MPTPGPESKYDYSETPYMPDWHPMQGREWAEKYIGAGPGGSNDEFGFQNELRLQIPYIFKGGSVPSWIPEVDYFLRHDRKGNRLDINYELARMPKPASVVESQKKAQEAKVIKDWEAAEGALRASEEAVSSPPPQQPETSSVETREGRTGLQDSDRAIRRKANRALKESLSGDISPAGEQGSSEGGLG